MKYYVPFTEMLTEDEELKEETLAIVSKGRKVFKYKTLKVVNENSVPAVVYVAEVDRQHVVDLVNMNKDNKSTFSEKQIVDRSNHWEGLLREQKLIP